VVWRLPYKLDGLGYTLAERIHLFSIRLDDPQYRQITQGDFELRGFDVSPDGRQIAYSRTRSEAQHCTDIWVMQADGGEPRRLSFQQSTASAPSWSPDGRWIFFTGATEEGDAQSRLWRIELATGAVDPLGDESLEVVPGTKPCWAADGRHFAFVLARRGLQHVAVIGLLDGHCELRVTGERQIERLAATADRLLFSCTSPRHAPELFSAHWDGRQERQLSRFNAWWDERKAPHVQWRQFTVPDGLGGEEQIDGWLMLPAGHRQGPLPLLVDVHGGPASYVLLSYTSHPHWPVLCAQGWAVLALNCVGSSSYGREFSSRLRARWGELDLQQHQAAVKALQAEGTVSDRLAILGKSYGGYLSAWAIGHTQLFRSAVVMAPVGNLETHYGSSDSGYYADPYSMCGEPFIDRETSRKLSPMQYVQQTATPTLFLQGKDDERCPKCQSEELYVTIARAGSTPTELVLYPKGSHHFWESGRPSHRLHALNRALDWLNRWIAVAVPGGASGARARSETGMSIAK
jgi:dipeptidyl aminopeptidase/acylaminoacyl peptidase